MAVQLCKLRKQIMSCHCITNPLKIRMEADDTVSLNKTKTLLKPLVTTLKLVLGYPIIAFEVHELENLKEAGNQRKICEDEEFDTKVARPEFHYKMVALNVKSLWMWYSHILKLVNIFLLLTLMFNLAFDVAFPAKLVEFGPSFYDLSGSASGPFIAITATLKILGIIVVFLNTKPFVLWLNRWDEFERHFFSCFGSRRNIDFQTNLQKFLCNVLIYFFFLPQIFFIFVGLPFMEGAFVYHVKYVGFGILSWGSIVFWQQEILEECKAHITIQTNVSAFEQIREGIRKRKLQGDIKHLEVVEWRSLIVLARNQTSLLFSSLKSQQLLNIADTIITCSIGLSSLLLVAADGEIAKITTPPYFGTVSTCACSLFKLYIKILRAERIPAQELLIAKEILDLEEKCIDPSTKAELKFLHAMLTRNTITTNLGNYCSMDKTLLLQVGVQVVTYLIVIIQFQGFSGASSKMS